MAPPVLTVNGVDLATFGLWVEQPDGWADAPSQRDVIVPVPGRAGGFLSPGESTRGPRTVTVTGVLVGDSASDARSKWDAAKKHLASPILELEFALWPDRMAFARYADLAWSNVGSLTGGAGFTLTFLLANPYLQAKTVEPYTALHGQRVPITLGSAPSNVRIRLIGIGATLPQVAYLDTQGLVAGAFTFDLLDSLEAAVALTTAEWIEIDTDTMEMLWHKADATIVNATRYLSLASTLFTLDPHDGDTTQGPVLVPANCSMVALVRKAWL